MMMVLRLLALAAFAVIAPALGTAAEAPAEGKLSIVTASGSHPFAVEVMRSQAELEKGLMFRRQMPVDAGMLFDFGAPQTVSMWMKNTYLPLDMLFIGKNGRVVRVQQDAVPMSEDIIPSGGAVTGVLEVNAGTAKRIGVKAGDVVHHPMFGS